MNEKIYYAEGNQRRGPFTLEQISGFDLHPHTLIWYKGLSEWTPICQAPLTESFYIHILHPEPDSYLGGAILSTIFCFFPLGIVAIFKSLKVNRLYKNKRYKEAELASKKAYKLVELTIIIGLLIVALNGIRFIIPSMTK